MSIKETLRMNFDPDSTLVLMYCSVFMDEQDWKEAERFNKVIYVDSRPPQMNLDHIGLLLYAKGVVLPVMALKPDGAGRTVGIKYSSNLLEILDPKFLGPSVYANYWRLMYPFSLRGVTLEGTTPVMHDLRAYAENYQKYQDYYVAFTGTRNVEPIDYEPGKPIHSREVYRMPLINEPLVPRPSIKVVHEAYVYFCVTDSTTVKVRIEGQTGFTVSNIEIQVSKHIDHDHFQMVIDAAENNSSLGAVDELLKNYGYTLSAVDSLLKSLGILVSKGPTRAKKVLSLR